MPKLHKKSERGKSEVLNKNIRPEFERKILLT